METLTAHTSICRQTVIEGDRVFAQSVWTPTDSSDLRVGGTLGVAAVDPTFILQVEPATAAPSFFRHDETAVEAYDQ